MCGALALAEVAALYPRAGGIYVYLREAYGPLTAFLFGWLYLVIIPAGAGAIALVFAEYLGRLLPLAPGQIRGVATALIIVLAAGPVPLGPLRGGDPERLHRGQGAAILAMTAAAFLLGRARQRGLGPRRPVSATWGGFGLGVVTVLWAYNGWQDVTCLSGEVRDPGRALPRAIVGGTLTVVAVYLLPTPRTSGCCRSKRSRARRWWPRTWRCDWWGQPGRPWSRPWSASRRSARSMP